MIRRAIAANLTVSLLTLAVVAVTLWLEVRG